MEKSNTVAAESPDKNQMNNSDFEIELIDRFFDANSYYLHGFMSYLRDENALLDDPLDTVAIGLVVDDIINSPNKTKRLLQLSQFDRFNFYKQQLFDGIKYLRGSKISTQQMMEVVGSLGKSFAETLVELVSQQKTRKSLLDIVGLEPDENTGTPEKAEKIEISQIDSPEAKDEFLLETEDDGSSQIKDGLSLQTEDEVL